MNKKRFLLITLLFFFIIGARTSAQDFNNPRVHCLILDKTMSMTGHGGKDIWDDVKVYCHQWIDGVELSSTVLFYTFDKELHGPQVFNVNSDADRASIKDAVNNVRIDGQRTYIAKSLSSAINNIFDQYPSTNYNRRIFFITDGKEEQRSADFEGVIQKYRLERGPGDFLYYVDLNNLAPETYKEIIKNTEGADIGSGFAKFLTVNPTLDVVNYLIGGPKFFEQIYLVDNEGLFSSMKFDLKIDSIKKVGTGNVVPNININPSQNISKANADRLEDRKYKIQHIIDFINQSTCECDIYVSLIGRNEGDNHINFSPSRFVIQARNQPPRPRPVVKVLNGGWHTANAKMSTTIENLKKGEKIIKILELEFDKQAKDDNVYITWELSGDWDKFDYSFSQGTLKDNKLTIKAKDYKSFVDGNNGIAVTIEGKDDTEKGNYVLSMNVAEVTDNLNFNKNAMNAKFKFNYTTPPPPPLWQRLLVPVISLIILALIIMWILNAQAKFPKGLLQLGNDTVPLKGKKIVSVKDELEKMGILLEDDTDIVFDKKRFATFRGPQVRELKNCALECEGRFLTRGSIVRVGEEVKGLYDSNGNEIIIRYVN